MSSTQPKSAYIEPVDNETPDETSGTTGHPVEANTFTKAIDKIVKANYSSSKPKLQESNPFNGSDSKNSALSSSNANSTSEIVQIIQDNTAKVNYILFFLKGSALDCLEPALLDMLGFQISISLLRNSKPNSELIIP